MLLPGKKIVPERIREHRKTYYAALQELDRSWDAGNLELQPMEAYLAELFESQLAEAEQEENAAQAK